LPRPFAHSIYLCSDQKYCRLYNDLETAPEQCAYGLASASLNIARNWRDTLTGGFAMPGDVSDGAPIAKTSTSRFRIGARLKSIHHAVNGITAMVRHEHNARVHLAATVMVVALGLRLRVGGDEWRWLLLAIAMVWLTEALNTAIEILCDLVHPGFHPLVKRIKDVAAGAVLVAAITAALIGATIFWPHVSASVG
jgi:diacylglycerol kinase (ATP)